MLDQYATQIAHDVAKILELAGVLIIAFGAAANLGKFATQLFHPEQRFTAMAALRSNFGRSILLGLEFLVAADIINTVAVAPTLQSVMVLAAIVLIRTFLSWSLELEIDGRWPWQRKNKEKPVS